MRYSKIHYGAKDDEHPAYTRVTWSERQHDEAMADIKAAGWYIHWID